MSAPSAPTTHGEWAEHYARLGLPVVPVVPGSKLPYIKWRPFQTEYPTLDEVEVWWQQWPEASIGAVLEASPYLSLDRDGSAAVDLARSAGWHRDDAPTVRSGRADGGTHQWMTKPRGRALRDRIALRADGAGSQLDVRCKGIVILPPSLHQTGRRYEWVVPFDPARVPPAPDSLLAECAQPETPAGTTLVDGPIPEGQREKTLTRILGAARRCGADERDLAALATSVNHRCTPPLSERDLARVVRSMAGYPAVEDDEPEIVLDTAPTTTAPAITFYTARDLCTQPDEAGRFVLAPFVYAEAIGDWASPPKDGKSTLLRAMVRAKVTGTSFLGYPAPEPGPVVILSEERKHSLVEGLQAAGLTERDDVHIALARDLRAATWPQAVEAAWRLCEQVGATWLICDTVHGLARVPEELENAAAGAHLSLNPLKPVAEAGIGITTTRHHRKSGGSVVDAGRGSNAFAGEVDVLTAVRLVSGQRHVRQLESIGRFRDLPTVVRVELVRGAGGDTYRLVDADDDTPDPTTTAVLSVLWPPDRPGRTREEIAGATGLSETTVERTLRPLVASGAVHQTGTGKRGSPLRYSRIGFVSDSSQDGD